MVLVAVSSTSSVFLLVRWANMIDIDVNFRAGSANSLLSLIYCRPVEMPPGKHGFSRGDRRGKRDGRAQSAAAVMPG